jgi:hypothetical protein
MSKNIVVVHFDRDGDCDFLASGDLRLIIVDERAPHDRAYEIKGRDDQSAIWEIIGDEEKIGSCDDERHEAVAARVTGKKFNVVEGGKE